MKEKITFGINSITKSIPAFIGWVLFAYSGLVAILELIHKLRPKIVTQDVMNDVIGLLTIICMIAPLFGIKKPEQPTKP